NHRLTWKGYLRCSCDRCGPSTAYRSHRCNPSLRAGTSLSPLMAISGGERIQPVDDKHARFDVSDIQGDKVATCLWLCAMPGAFSNVSAVVRRIGQVAKIGLGQPAHLLQLLFAADVRFDGVDYQIQGCPASGTVMASRTNFTSGLD